MRMLNLKLSIRSAIGHFTSQPVPVMPGLKMAIKSIAWLIVLDMLMIGNTVQAQSIFSNAITNSNPSSANPFTAGQVVAANLSASGIGRGSGIGANAGGDRYNATGWSTGNLDLNDYFTFTLTPNANYRLNLASFVYSGQASGTGPDNFAFRSSLDAYGANIGSPSAGGATIILSAAAYQNISGSVTFRFYGWGGSNASGTYSINDFTFNGSVSLALPVELVDFTAKTTDLKSAFLSFSTASERNNSHFEIERSTDAQTFTQIGRVAGAGNSDAPQNYTFTDLKPARGTNYYRLKQMDFDGNFSYSIIRSVVFGKSGSLLLFPSPTPETLNIQLEDTFASDAPWQIIDLAGRIVLTGILAGEQQVYQIPVSTLVEGVYVLRLVADQEVLTQEFVKK